MRAYVFTDKSLEPYAGRFVWLSIDTENVKNANFLKKYPVSVWPSFYVIDPKSEKIVFRWTGGATVSQLRRILDDAGKTRKKGASQSDQLFARAEKLYGENKYAQAAAAYREALAATPVTSSRYGRAMESLLFSLVMAKQHHECARAALDAYGKLKSSPSAANIAAFGLDCALSIPAGQASRKELIPPLEQAAKEVMGNPKITMSGDDRSGIYQILEAAREDAGDQAGKLALLNEHSAFLEGAASRAKTAEERTVFDSHRVSLYLELEQAEKAIPMLEASERDLPEDYNPPARLALAYRALKRYDDALAASDRALARAYGPRKIGILRTRSDIYKDKGDAAAARRTLEEAIAYAEALPEGQKSDATIASLRKKLAAL